MRKTLSKALAFVVFTGVMAIAGAAEAQSWSEANTPGFFGGYGHFGGYYDTFGDYGGQTNYRGYVRSEGYRTQSATLLTVPLQRRSGGQKRLYVSTAAIRSDCGWLKRRARDTGQRKWKIRYDACRAHA